MKKATSNTKSVSVRRGRPQQYPLSASQVKMINTRLTKGLSAAKIANELGVHEFAVLRIRRGSSN